MASHITENIFLGSYDDAKDIDFLRKRNIKHIVNVAEECKNYPITDVYHHKFDIRNDADITIDTLNKIYDLLTTIGDLENILIHCAHGKSRSVSIVLYYLMKRGYTLKDAIAFAKLKRPIIDPSVNFIKLLSTIDNTFDIDEYYVAKLKTLFPDLTLTNDEIRNAIINNNYDLNEIANFFLSNTI